MDVHSAFMISGIFLSKCKAVIKLGTRSITVAPKARMVSILAGFECSGIQVLGDQPLVIKGERIQS